MSRHEPEGWNCWRCGGKNWPGVTRCSRCGTRDSEQEERKRMSEIPGPSGLR
ncbi:hypothetical protein VPHD148_0117 [Vibrio phage D148]